MWLPPHITEKQLRERAEFEHELRSRVVTAELMRVKGVLDEFNYELRQIDGLLELVRAPADCGLTGMKPHYYHCIRWNEGAPPSFMIIEGEHGEFVEPTARLFEKLREADLWDPANVRRMRGRHSRADAAAAKFKARENAERQEEIRDRVIAATRTQVSMNRDVPWTQNMSPASQRERGSKMKAKKAA